MKGLNMSLLSKVTVSVSVIAAVAVVGTTKASADTVDTTSETAVTQEANLVIRGVEADGKTIVPTGSARIVYLKNHNFDPNVVQQKVNDLLCVDTSSSNITNTQSSAASNSAASAVSSDTSSSAPSAAPSAATTPAPTTSSVTASSTTTATSSSQSTTKTDPVTTNSTSTGSALSQSDQSAKEWIAQHESNGSYTARNGRYVGRYQLDSSYLNGDYSVANQEKVASGYVTGRYGSWSNAKQFWINHGWY